MSMHDDAWLQHCRLGHINLKLLKNISSKEYVHGLPKLRFIKDHPCETCVVGKKIHASHKEKLMMSTSIPLKLLHVDLVCPIPKHSMGESLYVFVIVGDYSRFTWVEFLKFTSAFKYFATLCQRI